jgi:hypothetical protein
MQLGEDSRPEWVYETSHSSSSSKQAAWHATQHSKKPALLSNNSPTYSTGSKAESMRAGADVRNYRRANTAFELSKPQRAT